MLSTDIIDNIKRRGLEIAAEIEAKCGPYRAEIVPDCSPSWHLVRSAPSLESRAAKRLMDRGFGVYLPMIREYRVSRGRKVRHSELFFPGYVFLFVWDVKKHWRRIKSCSGVQGVVCVDEQPIVVPDSVINKLQGLEMIQDDDTWKGLATVVDVKEKKPKRRWRRTPKVLKGEPEEHPSSAVELTSSTRSYWNDFESVDSETRLGALHTALGLVSQRPSGAGLAG